MKIHKIFNNNVVQSVDDQGSEIVVFGQGIAYQRNIGDYIPENKIQKRFVLQDSNQATRLNELLNEVPVIYFELAERIITFAEQYLSIKLNSNIYITLADHISFSVTRFENDLILKNPLLSEIRSLYKREFVVGLFALDLVEKEIQIKLPIDEAGVIVMHIINMQMGIEDDSYANKLMKIVSEIAVIVEANLNFVIDDESMEYNRLLIHLRFFAQRILSKQSLSSVNLINVKNFAEMYAAAYEIAIKIKDYTETTYKYLVDESEILYLSVHIQRLIEVNKKR